MFIHNIIYFLKLTKITITFSIVAIFYHKNKEKKWNKFRITLQNLGPIFIKLGQTVSSRPDLIGEDFAKELSILQDKLPPFNFNIVQTIIQKELGSPIENHFLSFEKMPRAAASMAQVHKATTINGQEVAVKVLRPDIEKFFEQDIDLLLWIAHFIENNFSKAKRLKLIQIVKLLEDSVRFELDLRLEAAAASELSENNEKHKTVYIPKILWNLTTEKIMTLEWIEGISIGKKEDLINAGHDLEKICQSLATCFFYQAYQDGFFHADLHPGNIIVTPNGVLALIDFGIMGRLDHKTRLYIAEILHSFLKRDYKRVAEIHFEAGYISPDKSLKLFTQACRAIGEPIVGLPTNQISVGKLLTQLFKITATFEMETQVDLIMLQKTTLLVEGVGMYLSPGLNLWKLAEPWIAKWATSNISPEAKIIYNIKKFVKHFPESFKNIKSPNTPTIVITEKPIKNYGYRWQTLILIASFSSIVTYYLIKLLG